MATHAAAADPGAPPARPNFVIIMADDMGYGDASCYGNTEYRTPHIDELAVRGLKFTDFHSSGSVCSPTRAGLMTGRYQQRAGIPGVITAANHRHHGLHVHEVTFSRLLQEAGYRTAIFGKWHLGYRREFNPVRHGFDEFRGYVSGNVDFFSHIDQTGVYDWWDGENQIVEDGYTTHLITQHAVRFIEENQERSFCLYLPHEAPHYPYQGPSDEPERTVGGEFEVLGGRPDKRQAYREMMEELDKGVGEVTSALERHGLSERTLVIFFSDNGATPLGNNGPLRGGKGTDWEGGHRVPCLAVWPGKIPAGSVTDELAISLDIMPTLLAAAGVNLPRGHRLDGVDLSPLLFEQKPPGAVGSELPIQSANEAGAVTPKQPREGPLGERKLVWNGRAIRQGKWKLVRGQRRQQGIALFDLDADIGETRNLADRHPQRVRDMLAALEEWEDDVTREATVQPDK